MAEAVDGRVGMAPGITESAGIERVDHGADFGQNGEEVGTGQQVLYLNSDVVGEVGPFAVERLDYADRVRGSVEKVGVAKGDVAGAGGHLLADVGEDDLGLHDAERSAVDRHHRAVAAAMFAA